MKNDLAAKTAILLGAVAMSMTLAFITGFFVWLLWNMCMPQIFALKHIGYAQAVCLSALISILFKSNVTVNKK